RQAREDRGARLPWRGEDGRETRPRAPLGDLDPALDGRRVLGLVARGRPAAERRLPSDLRARVLVPRPEGREWRDVEAPLRRGGLGEGQGPAPRRREDRPDREPREVSAAASLTPPAAPRTSRGT